MTNNLPNNNDESERYENAKSIKLGKKTILDSVFKPSKLGQEMQSLYKDKRIMKEIPEVLYFLHLSSFQSRLLRGIHIILGVSATLFSLLAATLIQIDNTDNDNIYNISAKILALVAAASIALMTSFDLGTKSNNIVRAWRLLNAAIIKFNNVKENGDVQKVIESYEKAEEIIGDVMYRDTGNH
jgi:hypothetical protein